MVNRFIIKMLFAIKSTGKLIIKLLLLTKYLGSSWIFIFIKHYHKYDEFLLKGFFLFSFFIIYYDYASKQYILTYSKSQSLLIIFWAFTTANGIEKFFLRWISSLFFQSITFIRNLLRTKLKWAIDKIEKKNLFNQI